MQHSFSFSEKTKKLDKCTFVDLVSVAGLLFASELVIGHLQFHTQGKTDQ